MLSLNGEDDGIHSPRNQELYWFIAARLVKEGRKKRKSKVTFWAATGLYFFLATVDQPSGSMNDSLGLVFLSSFPWKPAQVEHKHEIISWEDIVLPPFESTPRMNVTHYQLPGCDIFRSTSVNSHECDLHPKRRPNLRVSSVSSEFCVRRYIGREAHHWLILFSKSMGFCLIIPFGIAFSLAFHVKHLRVIRNQRIAIDVEEPLLPHKSMAITKQGMRWDARPDLAIGNLNVWTVEGHHAPRRTSGMRMTSPYDQYKLYDESVRWLSYSIIPYPSGLSWWNWRIKPLILLLIKRRINNETTGCKTFLRLQVNDGPRSYWAWHDFCEQDYLWSVLLDRACFRRHDQESLSV